MIDFLISVSSKAGPDQEFSFMVKPEVKFHFENTHLELFLWGDPIFEAGKTLNETKDFSLVEFLHNTGGHYYYFLKIRQKNIIMAGNSLFSILPVYFNKDKVNDVVYLSNKPEWISDRIGSARVNKKFILENLLFKYPIFNDSCFEGIGLLASNHYIELFSNQIKIIRHTAVESMIPENPVPWKKSVDDVAEVFIKSCRKYLPDDFFVSALTGGFDGRTLTACSKFYERNFNTYSFGSVRSDDIVVPTSLSEKAGVNFMGIILDNEYVGKHSLNCGLEFIHNCNGTASFSRAHYLYATKLLSNKTRTLITGNFGSEVFRAAHIAGVVISSNLFKLFSSTNYEEGIKTIENSVEWNFLKKDQFIDEWNSLKEDIRNLPCYSESYKSMSKNSQFYVFVFEEIFRKYFGAEMQNQFKYFVNRTPFLDYEFLKTILSTGLAGVHSEFFTHNPLKRFKGQVLYAHIIKKTYPEFGKLLTDKGYKPDDLLDFSGKMKIFYSFLKKKYSGKKIVNHDPYAVNAAFSHNTAFFEKLIQKDSEWFNVSFAKECLDKLTNRDSLFILLSQMYYYNFIKK